MIRYYTKRGDKTGTRYQAIKFNRNVEEVKDFIITLNKSFPNLGVKEKNLLGFDENTKDVSINGKLVNSGNFIIFMPSTGLLGVMGKTAFYEIYKAYEEPTNGKTTITVKKPEKIVVSSSKKEKSKTEKVEVKVTSSKKVVCDNGEMPIILPKKECTGACKNGTDSCKDCSSREFEDNEDRFKFPSYQSIEGVLYFFEKVLKDNLAPDYNEDIKLVIVEIQKVYKKYSYKGNEIKNINEYFSDVKDLKRRTKFFLKGIYSFIEYWKNEKQIKEDGYRYIIREIKRRKEQNPSLQEKENCHYLHDKGFVYLVDSMGNDDSIVQAARCSYGAGTKTVREDEKLIEYLLKNGHTSPFEQVEFKFHIKLPIFVMRQLVRHRTASLNELSGRYSEFKDEFYIPGLSRIQKQSKDNKQGSSDDDFLPMIDRLEARKEIEKIYEESYKSYQKLLKLGVSRETARIVLPLATYTECYWKMDLNNLFKFFMLRLDKHAQWEIRELALEMYIYVKQKCPIACAAFEKYVLQPKGIETDFNKNLNS